MEYARLMLCDGYDCDCAQVIDIDDLVVTPDGLGKVITLMESTADVQVGGVIGLTRYDLSLLHLPSWRAE